MFGEVGMLGCLEMFAYLYFVFLWVFGSTEQYEEPPTLDHDGSADIINRINANNNIDAGGAPQRAGGMDRRRALAATGLAALSLLLGDAFGSGGDCCEGLHQDA